MSSAKLFSNSNLFLRENATEASFKSNASNAGILHFATHAFVDLENPLNSHLVLSEKDTINEDGILYAHELMGLNLNAELAILSACNTGVGKPENIEGAQNLAYAFAFSGVKNVLVTLWNTADASAPIIVKRFLENTSNGEPIGAALSNAKKDYINQADDIMANPFYWANFSLQGNPNDVIVEENKAPIFLIIGGAVFLLFGLGFVILKARK
jgi:CHAT domain-containing protein